MIDLDAILPWAAVEERAKTMFDLHHRERGLAWAKQAWTYFEAEELTNCYDSFSSALVHLRLVALALIYDGYSKAVWNMAKDQSPLQWAAGMTFTPFALGKLCGMDPEPIQGYTDEEMGDATIEHTAVELRWEVCMALVQRYGSVDALHASMWYTRYDPQDPSAPDAFAMVGRQNAGLAYLEQLLSNNP